jgi:phosphoribosyl 1,2-cyclic phosphate phosphodiesterase
MKITMLGVGSSGGTPAIGCQCETCTSSDHRNKRTRCSSLVTLDNGKNILIDTGPDLRQQALREGVLNINAVLYTHTHADHLNGIDDLRAFCVLQKEHIPLYGSPANIKIITEKFSYAFRETNLSWELPVLKANAIEAAFEVLDEQITPIPLKHGNMDIYGYRIHNFAYLTDVSVIPESSFALLKGLDVLFLDCLRSKPHFTHIHLEQSLAYASQINAKKTYLIHMTHEFEYQALSKQLPDNVLVGYDGLRIEL